MSTNVMAYTLFMTAEQIENEKKQLLEMVLKSVHYYVFLNYKTSKNLDCYDIEQICNKITRYENYLPEIAYMKNYIISDLIQLSEKLKNSQSDKAQATAEELKTAQAKLLEIELQQKEAFLKNIMSLKWPFDKKYNDCSVKYEITRKKVERLQKQLDKIQCVRAAADYEEVKEFCAMLEKKYNLNF